MIDLVTDIALAIEDLTDDVKVVQNKGTQSAFIEFLVAEEDVGKVIGEKGRTADGLKTIISNILAKKGVNYFIEIVE